jgi:tetratricopeptide (TPR) repeat protein
VVDGERVEGRPIAAEAYAAYAKAELHAAQGDRKHALELLAAALDQDPASPELVTRYGELLCDGGAGARALERFERALDLDPEYAPAYLGRARCLERLGRRAEALAAAQHAAYLDPMALATTREVSLMLFSRGRTSEAWRWLEARVLLEPASRAANALLLEAALREKDDARTARARRALALTGSELTADAGAALRALPAEPRQALERAERRLAADPDDTDAWIAGLVAADLLGEEARFGALLASLGESPLSPTPAALSLLTDLLERRCGPDAAAALSLAARPEVR